MGGKRDARKSENSLLGEGGVIETWLWLRQEVEGCGVQSLAHAQQRSRPVAVLMPSQHPSIRHLSTRIMRSEAEKLLVDLYGDPGGKDVFPKPMPEGEAGDCANGDRRYLWTDAFGVLAYVSLAKATNNPQFVTAAQRLVDAVHEGLGKPRSAQFPMTPDLKGLSPSGYVGLRIGKERARAHTDLGMAYDGMYWHYVDKWLFALLRLGQETGDAARIHQAAAIAKSVFPYFYDPAGGGVRWKINMDASPITSQPAGPSDDTLNALVMYKLIEHAVWLNAFHRCECPARLRACPSLPYTALHCPA